MDDFTLPNTDWDVVIAGTGVKLSLLACALSRARLSVLQIDPSPYYGSQESAFSLSELEEYITSLPSSSARFTLHSTPAHRDRDYTFTLAPHLVYWNAPLLEFLRDVKMTSSFTWLPAGSWWVWLSDAAVKERGDAKEGGLEGAMVNLAANAVKAGGTIRKKAGWNRNRKSAPPGAGALEALAAGESAATSGESPASSEAEASTAPAAPSSSSPSSASAATLRRHGDLREVPCTVEDIAWSQDLEGQDRATLGRFLRFVQKSVSTGEEETSEASLLTENANTPLASFLSAHFPLPPAAIASIHSLTLLPTPPSTTPLQLAVERLRTHLFSLGSIAEIRSAAALTIAYGGSAELCQVWSRGAAVAGGLNILSCDITDCSASTDDGGKIKLSISTHPQTPVTAKHLIVESPSSDATSPSVSYHGIYLLSTPLTQLFEKKLQTDAVAPASVVVAFPADQDARAGLGNEAPIYLQVRSAATYECRKGESVVYATTTNEQDRKLLKKVVEMIVGAVDGQTGEEKVVMSCEYSSADLRRETKTQSQVDACGGENVLKVQPLNRDLVFDNEAVEECRKVYERLVGSREAFCEPPPEFAGFAEGEEED